MTTHNPGLILAHGSAAYRFDRITADEIAWFSELHGPNQIASAPRSVTASDLHHGGNGHTSHGSGNGYGHEKHHETAEPATAALLICGVALLVIRRVWA
jgi:hypothetical protein